MDDRLRALLERLGDVDWPAAMHRAGMFARILRGDASGAVDADSERERQRATQTRGLTRAVTRWALGCKLPAACSCALCEEDRQAPP